MPTPKKNETKDDFIGRCISYPDMNKEFPDKSQRAAVCYSKWDKHLKESVVEEKAVSQAQQHFFGMVHAYQKGKLDTSSIPKDVLAKIKKTAESITKKEAKKFASTKHKGLPTKVSESRMTFKEFLMELDKQD